MLDSKTHFWFLSWIVLNVVGAVVVIRLPVAITQHSACVVAGLPSLAGLLSFGLEWSPLAVADLSLFLPYALGVEGGVFAIGGLAAAYCLGWRGTGCSS